MSKNKIFFIFYTKTNFERMGKYKWHYSDVQIIFEEYSIFIFYSIFQKYTSLMYIEYNTSNYTKKYTPQQTYILLRSHSHTSYIYDIYKCNTPFLFVNNVQFMTLCLFFYHRSL